MKSKIVITATIVHIGSKVAITNKMTTGSNVGSKIPMTDMEITIFHI